MITVGFSSRDRCGRLKQLVYAQQGYERRQQRRELASVLLPGFVKHLFGEVLIDNFTGFIVDFVIPATE